jgi:hypothetical protein
MRTRGVGEAANCCMVRRWLGLTRLIAECKRRAMGSKSGRKQRIGGMNELPALVSYR